MDSSLKMTYADMGHSGQFVQFKFIIVNLMRLRVKDMMRFAVKTEVCKLF